MKVFIFVMILFVPAGQLPVHEEPMESLNACIERAEKVTREFANVDEDFRAVAACRIVSTKSNPT